MFYNPTRVSEYNEAGWVRDLPDLLQGRRNHGCTYYNNDDGTKVDIESYDCPITCNNSDIPRIWWLHWT